jgi:hypothetical protein
MVLVDMLDDIAMSEAQRNVARSNRLLGALEIASRELIDPHLEPIKLKLGDIVCEAGGLLKHAYFPQASRCVGFGKKYHASVGWFVTYFTGDMSGDRRNVPYG